MSPKQDHEGIILLRVGDQSKKHDAKKIDLTPGLVYKV
jgi:hypothetical protein